MHHILAEAESIVKGMYTLVIKRKWKKSILFSKAELFFRIIILQSYLSRVMRKLYFCLYENKGADQLRSDCKADQRLCFRLMDSTIPLLYKSKNFQPLSSVTVQPGLCWVWSEPTLLFFSCTGSNYMHRFTSSSRSRITMSDNSVSCSPLSTITEKYL